MFIYTLDGLNGVYDIIDTFESVIWNVQYFDLNDFELVVPGTQKNIDMLVPDRFLVREVDMAPGVFKNVMVVENRTLEFDMDKGWILTVSGKGLKKIVGQRIVWSQTNLTGNVETGIRSVITNNIISPSVNARKINNFILSALKGFTDSFDVQLFGENIAEWLVSICQTYGYGWDVYISGGKYVFDLYKGNDRTHDQNTYTPVIFSLEYDNILEFSYKYEGEEFKNAALIGGEGEGTSQRTASIGTSTGLARFEDYIDGSSVSSNGEIITASQYTEMLKNYGKEELSATAFTETFEGKIIQTDMYTLNEDYFIGDIVEVDMGFVSAKSRIIEMIYSEDENGSELTPTFSKWED